MLGLKDKNTYEDWQPPLTLPPPTKGVGIKTVKSFRYKSVRPTAHRRKPHGMGSHKIKIENF